MVLAQQATRKHLSTRCCNFPLHLATLIPCRGTITLACSQQLTSVLSASIIVMAQSHLFRSLFCKYRLGTLDSPIPRKRIHSRACPLFAQAWRIYFSACPKLAQPPTFRTFFCWCNLCQITRCTARSELIFDLAQNSAHPSKTRARTLHTLLVVNWWPNLAHTDGREYTSFHYLVNTKQGQYRAV